MIDAEIEQLSEVFWGQVDNLIVKHLDTITLGNFAEAYWGFCDRSQKEMRGTKDGLHGFSEFFAMRAALHYLASHGLFSQDSAKDKQKRTDLTHVFIRGRLVLSGGVDTMSGCKPDILLTLDDNPWGVIEVKTWFTGKVEDQRDRFAKIAPGYPCLRWAFLAGGLPGRKHTVQPGLPRGDSAFCYRHLNGTCADTPLVEVFDWVFRPKELSELEKGI